MKSVLLEPWTIAMAMAMLINLQLQVDLWYCRLITIHPPMGIGVRDQGPKKFGLSLKIGFLAQKIGFLAQLLAS